MLYDRDVLISNKYTSRARAHAVRTFDRNARDTFNTFESYSEREKRILRAVFRTRDSVRSFTTRRRHLRAIDRSFYPFHERRLFIVKFRIP